MQCFLDSNMLHVLQNEINVMHPSERINIGVLDLLSNGFLRLHFIGKEHIQGLGVFGGVFGFFGLVWVGGLGFLLLLLLF